MNEKLQLSRQEYFDAFQDLQKYRRIYVHDMTTLFAKCQEMEGGRLNLFKSALFCVHNALNINPDQW